VPFGPLGRPLAHVRPFERRKRAIPRDFGPFATSVHYSVALG
jgi:hypothetical protein